MGAIAMRVSASDSFIIGLAEQHRRCLCIQVRNFPIIWRCDYLASGFWWRNKLIFSSVKQFRVWITANETVLFSYLCKSGTCKSTIDRSSTLSTFPLIDCSLYCNRTASFSLWKVASQSHWPSVVENTISLSDVVQRPRHFLVCIRSCSESFVNVRLNRNSHEIHFAL